MSKLNALAIKNLTKPGMHADGNGLYLYVGSKGARSWIFRYSLHSRRREMGLGPVDVVPLSKARERAFEYRKLIEAGRDPITLRELERKEREREEANVRTLGECIDEYLIAHGSRWKERQRLDWRNSMQTHMRELVGLPVAEIEREAIVAELQKIWERKPVMAHRVQERLEKAFGFAKVKGYFVGENPATWKNNLSFLLSAKSKGDGHFVSMARSELPSFYASLNGLVGTSFRALQFLILTVPRTGECVQAEWCEIDFEAGLWTIPGKRMKAKRDHVVPLSQQAIALLQGMYEIRQNEFIFPSRMYGRALSKMALLTVMRRFGRQEDPHGFRSTFKDWARELTDYPDDLSEFALAHKIPDKVKAAYLRTTMVERRRSMMQEWADFCAPRSLGELTPTV